MRHLPERLNGRGWIEKSTLHRYCSTTGLGFSRPCFYLLILIFHFFFISIFITFSNFFFQCLFSFLSFAKVSLRNLTRQAWDFFPFYSTFLLSKFCFLVDPHRPNSNCFRRNTFRDRQYLYLLTFLLPPFFFISIFITFSNLLTKRNIYLLCLKTLHTQRLQSTQKSEFYSRLHVFTILFSPFQKLNSVIRCSAKVTHVVLGSSQCRLHVWS